MAQLAEILVESQSEAQRIISLLLDQSCQVEAYPNGANWLIRHNGSLETALMAACSSTSAGWV